MVRDADKVLSAKRVRGFIPIVGSVQKTYASGDCALLHENTVDVPPKAQTRQISRQGPMLKVGGEVRADSIASLPGFNVLTDRYSLSGKIRARYQFSLTLHDDVYHRQQCLLGLEIVFYVRPCWGREAAHNQKVTELP